MEKQKLIQYLRDVFELEKQKMIAQNVMEYIAKEYQKAESNFKEGQKKYKIKMESYQYIPLGICTYFTIVGVAGVGALSMPNVTVDMKSIPISFVAAVVCGLIYFRSYKKNKNEQTQVNAMAVVLGKKGESDMVIFSEHYKMMSKIYHENERVLEKLYSLNIIYPKYHYLEAVGMFLEYLMAGRTRSLEAKETDQGAYNIYEDEMYKGIIINKLDQVLSNQRVLIDGQRQISKQIDSLIHGISEVRKDIRDIKISVQTDTFCNEVTAYNTTVMRRIAEKQYYN